MEEGEDPKLEGESLAEACKRWRAGAADLRKLGSKAKGPLFAVAHSEVLLAFLAGFDVPELRKNILERSVANASVMAFDLGENGAVECVGVFVPPKSDFRPRALVPPGMGVGSSRAVLSSDTNPPMRSISPLGALLVAGAVLALTAVALVYFFSGATSLGPESARPPGSTSTAPADPKADAARAAGVEQPKKNTDVAVASPIVGESKPAAARAEAQSEEPNNPEPAKLGFAKGRVLDFDGKPAAGVKIFILAKKGMSMAPADTETDAKGDFQVSENVKKKKTMRLRASRKDRLPIVVEDVAFKLAETTDVGILQFKPSGSLEVLVTDRDNHPVPGAQISLEFPNERRKRSTSPPPPTPSAASRSFPN